MPHTHAKDSARRRVPPARTLPTLRAARARRAAPHVLTRSHRQACMAWPALARQHGKQSRQGERPSGRKFECAGCEAAVRSAHAVLGTRVADEGAVQELLESTPRVCSASNFEEAEQSRWSLPPPETSRACSSFIQVGVCWSRCRGAQAGVGFSSLGCPMTCRLALPVRAANRRRRPGRHDCRKQIDRRGPHRPVGLQRQDRGVRPRSHPNSGSPGRANLALIAQIVCRTREKGRPGRGDRRGTGWP